MSWELMPLSHIKLAVLRLSLLLKWSASRSVMQSLPVVTDMFFQSQPHEETHDRVRASDSY